MLSHTSASEPTTVSSVVLPKDWAGSSFFETCHILSPGSSRNTRVPLAHSLTSIAPVVLLEHPLILCLGSPAAAISSFLLDDTLTKPFSTKQFVLTPGAQRQARSRRASRTRAWTFVLVTSSLTSSWSPENSSSFKTLRSFHNSFHSLRIFKMLFARL